MSNYELIRDAIINKKQVVAVYKGYRREMCPHTLGWKGNKQQCLFYQFGGDSSSGAILPGSDRNWRCILVDELEDVLIQDGSWHTAKNHIRHQTCVDHIDIEASL
ncbi:hypothetical protein H6F95_06790 [Cyanobacteria bacterium FACHB-471]|nr:hypothetical protein [Cyanobacteria bacterium FACHB-471]